MFHSTAARRTPVASSALAAVALLCLVAPWTLPALAQAPSYAGARAVDRAPDPDLDDARTAAPPPVSAAAAGSTVRVSGTIRSLETGAGIYGKLVPWNEATGAVAGLIYASTDGVWSADLEPGTYAFYVRSFGHLPILLEHIAVAGPVTLDPVIDTHASRATPAYLTGSALADPIVLADGLDATTFTLTSTKDLGPSVDLLNEFGHLAADGEARGAVPLHDDGTHGDAVAGDRVYTSNAVGFAGATPNWGGRTSYDYLLYVRVPGGSPPLVSIPSATLIALTPDALLVPTALPGGAQCTPHAAAIVDDMSEPNFNWDQPASRAFFRSFADVYDFLYLFPTYGMADYAGLSGTVFNDVTGIGKSLNDNRWRFGSTRLMSCILMRAGITMPLLHETMHHWGATMDALFHTTSWGYHWGYAGVNGQLGGFDPATLRDNGDGTWAIRYCAPYGFAADDRPYGALELYIAGLVDTQGELGDIPVLVNPEMQGSWSRVAADRVDHVSAADIVATYGSRVPAPASSQHRFNAAFCWVGPRPVNAAAMSFLDLAARIFAGKMVVPMTHSFTTATRGVGAMDTRIRPRPGVHRRVAAVP